jgi:hypothetical protein
MKNVLQLINQHIKIFEREEKVYWDKVRGWLQGRYWTQNTGANESDMLKCSMNYVFAIVETASASLVSRNPQVTITSREDGGELACRKIEAYANMVLAENIIAQEMEMSISDVVMYGRSIIKTVWDKKKGIPLIRRLDPRCVLFDLTAVRPDDIKYWFELTYISPEEFEQRVADCLYNLTNKEEMPKGGAYPSWLQDGGGGSADTNTSSGDVFESLRAYQPWVPVYEVYDTVKGTCEHWFDGQTSPLFTEKDDYNPYTLFFLNDNKIDCRGLSEILLVAPNIDDINKTLTYMLNLVRRQIPRVMVDANNIDVTQIDKINQSGIASYVPVKTNSEGGRNLSDSFFPTPTADIPANIMDWLAKLESNVSFVSALAEAARGQVTGAKTATELALIEAQLKTRLQSRQSRVDRAFADLGRKIVYLSSLYLPKTINVELTSGHDSGWSKLSRKEISSVDTKIEIVPFDIGETNRPMYEERYMKLLAYMTARPSFDQHELDEEFVKMFRLNPKVIMPKEEQAPPPQQEAIAAPTPDDIAAVAAEQGVSPEQVAQAVSAQGTEPSTLPPQAANTSNNAVLK